MYDGHYPTSCGHLLSCAMMRCTHMLWYLLVVHGMLILAIGSWEPV